MKPNRHKIVATQEPTPILKNGKRTNAIKPKMKWECSTIETESGTLLLTNEPMARIDKFPSKLSGAFGIVKGALYRPKATESTPPLTSVVVKKIPFAKKIEDIGTPYGKDNVIQSPMLYIEREIAVWQTLNKAGIGPKLLDAIISKDHDGNPCVYLVMEDVQSLGDANAFSKLVSGKSFRSKKLLSELQLENGKASCVLLLKIAGKLKTMQEAGFTHRDFKPENVLVCNSGEVKLIDFSFTVPLTDKTAQNKLQGSPQYMPPEIILREGTANNGSNDTWAFFVTCCELLLGKPPIKLPKGNIKDPKFLEKYQERVDQFFKKREKWLRTQNPVAQFLAKLSDPDPDKRPSMKDAEQLLIKLIETQFPNTKMSQLMNNFSSFIQGLTNPMMEKVQQKKEASQLEFPFTYTEPVEIPLFCRTGTCEENPNGEFAVLSGQGNYVIPKTSQIPTAFGSSPQLEGGYGVVSLGHLAIQEKDRPQTVLIKRVPLKAKKGQVQHPKSPQTPQEGGLVEAFNWSQVNDIPGVVNLVESILVSDKTGTWIYFVMEDTSGFGDLSQCQNIGMFKPGIPFIQGVLKETKLTQEQVALYLLRQIAETVQQFHNKGLTNGDLKLQNLVLHNGIVRSIDFSFVCESSDTKRINSVGGSPMYAPPEIIEAQFDEKLRGNAVVGTSKDMWCLFVAAHILLKGTHMIDDSEYEDMLGLYQALRKYNHNHASREPAENQRIDHLLWELSEPDPNKRMKIDEFIHKLDIILEEKDVDMLAMGPKISKFVKKVTPLCEIEKLKLKIQRSEKTIEACKENIKEYTTEIENCNEAITKLQLKLDKIDLKANPTEANQTKKEIEGEQQTVSEYNDYIKEIEEYQKQIEVELDLITQRLKVLSN